MRCSSKSLFFRRGGDGLGLSRLVPSKDAGEAVPLIALVCSGVLVGATFMSRQILHSPGFYASREERKRGIDEPVQEKRVRGQKWYKHRVRRYFEERNKTKAPGELLPWLNAMFAPIHQPYDDVVGRKRT